MRGRYGLRGVYYDFSSPLVTDELLTVDVRSYYSLRGYWHLELEMLW